MCIYQPLNKHFLYIFPICDPLSQNEHKVATAAFPNYYRFKFFIIQSLKWHIICGYSSLFCPAKINILCWFSFDFYCSVTCITGYISVYKLTTLRSFCGSRSHISPRIQESILTKILVNKNVKKWILLSVPGCYTWLYGQNPIDFCWISWHKSIWILTM